MDVFSLLEAFLAVLKPMLRIMLFIGTGFALRRMNILPENADRTMSKLVTMLFLPALLLHTNLLECRVDSLVSNGGLVLCGAVISLCTILLAKSLAPFFSRGNRYDEGIYRYALAFPNSGGVGTPLILAMFGTNGLFLATLFQFAIMIFNYSYGINQLQPSDRRSGLREILKSMVNPTLIALIAGILLGVLGVGTWMPGIVLETVEQLGSCYVPVSLLMVGYSVGGFSLGFVFGDSRTYLYSLLRLLVIPGAVLAVLRLLGLPDIYCVMAVLYLACPSGMNTVVFPSSYGMDCKAGVGMVLVSSILAVVTLPLMYALTTL